MSSYQPIYDATKQALSCDVSWIIEKVAREHFDISWLKSHTQDAMWSVQREQERPFVLLKPKIFIDGNKWCALYGENLQDGVAGFGDSPDAAARDFDKSWNTTLSC